MYVNELTRDYQSPAFQQAFRSYADEMGIRVSNWEGLFCGMTDEGIPAIVRKDAAGQVIGFIQFSRMIMTSWFFEDRYGFIQEFWVHPAHRRKGYGAELLAQAESHFRKQGICKMILTTDNADGFYLRHGYRHDEDMVAKNGSKVYIKILP